VVDAAAIRRDLEDLVRIPSLTGAEDAIIANLADRLEALGLEVEIFHPDPAAMREDPAWPGEEVARASLPVVIARAGRAVGTRGRRPARGPGDLDAGSVGRRGA
jgi:acetylornithine deacetylase